MRKVFALIAAFVTIPGVAHAATPAPWPVGSTGFNDARNVAVAYWGADPCAGNAHVDWISLPAHVNALGDQASCRIALNATPRTARGRAARWTWAKFCTVLTHEYGHLLGVPHLEDDFLMGPMYRGAIRDCLPS